MSRHSSAGRSGHMGGTPHKVPLITAPADKANLRWDTTARATLSQSRWSAVSPNSRLRVRSGLLQEAMRHATEQHQHRGGGGGHPR